MFISAKNAIFFKIFARVTAASLSRTTTLWGSFDAIFAKLSRKKYNLVKNSISSLFWLSLKSKGYSGNAKNQQKRVLKVGTLLVRTLKTLSNVALSVYFRHTNNKHQGVGTSQSAFCCSKSKWGGIQLI